jgi:excisionase family DNA binding protein
MTEDFLTPKEAAERMKVCIKTVRRYIQSGKLDSTKLGYKTVRITRKSVDGLLKNGAK